MYVGDCHAYVHTKIRGHPVSFFIILQLILMRQDPLLNLEHGWLSVSPIDSSICTFCYTNSGHHVCIRGNTHCDISLFTSGTILIHFLIITFDIKWKFVENKRKNQLTCYQSSAGKWWFNDVFNESKNREVHKNCMSLNQVWIVKNNIIWILEKGLWGKGDRQHHVYHLFIVGDHDSWKGENGVKSEGVVCVFILNTMVFCCLWELSFFWYFRVSSYITVLINKTKITLYSNICL